MQYFFEFIFVLLIAYSLVLTFLMAKKPKPKVRIRPDIAIVDTSVLIDGRIEGIAKSGFITGTLVVPKFVLNELQLVADSRDALKRNRGRRGMKILQGLKANSHFKLEMPDNDYPEIREVDAKIIALAKERQANILTVDYNLNRVAEIQNIFTLNINELANSLKPAVLPGETIEVLVVQRGKERDQGVGYLDDGTMVVVENGIKFMRQNVQGIVSRIFQTDAGRMIFVRLKGERIDTSGPRRRFTPPWQWKWKNKRENS